MNEFQKILTKYWGYPDFRPLQETIIQSVIDKKDTLALMATGGGKSITFQVPALYMEGLCIVITPLIALMKDQVEKLQQLGIKAVALHSGMQKDEIKIAINNCLYGGYKFLYCSPERLGSELFQARIKDAIINLIAVDEAHCISQWGYDFRPSYLKIPILRDLHPEAPILALTATATPEVANDIQEKLKFSKQNVIQSSFDRKNLIYLVREIEDKDQYLVNHIKKTPGTGIIYVRNRKKTREIANLLNKNGLSADYYHAGLDVSLREKKQNEWLTEKTKIIVATNAFGMGIDKANVRYVLHYDIPNSLEEYFQEAGRAGRDGKKSFGVILYNGSDLNKINQRVANTFPDKKTILSVYNALFNYLSIPIGGGKGLKKDFSLHDFISIYRFSALIAYNSLKILETQGLLILTDEINNPSRIHFSVNRDDLYKFRISNSNYDAFLQLLLRTYSGVFSDYVRIDETYLAKAGKTNKDTIYQYLKGLAKMNIIKYIPGKKSPFIILTEERLEEKSISFDKIFQQRKENFISRLSAMMMYLTNSSKCRNQIMLSYFGEKNSTRCGKCDICQERNKLDLSRYEFDLILEEIKKIFEKEKQINIEKLIAALDYDKEKTLNVVQWLLDNKKIIRTDNELRWHL